MSGAFFLQVDTLYADKLYSVRHITTIGASMKIVTSVHIDGALARSKPEMTLASFTIGIGTVLMYLRDEDFADQAVVTMTATEARDIAATLNTFADMAEVPAVTVAAALKNNRSDI